MCILFRHTRSRCILCKRPQPKHGLEVMPVRSMLWLVYVIASVLLLFLLLSPYRWREAINQVYSDVAYYQKVRPAATRHEK